MKWSLNNTAISIIALCASFLSLTSCEKKAEKVITNRDLTSVLSYIVEPDLLRSIYFLLESYSALPGKNSQELNKILSAQWIEGVVVSSAETYDAVSGKSYWVVILRTDSIQVLDQSGNSIPEERMLYNQSLQNYLGLFGNEFTVLVPQDQHNVTSPAISAANDVIGLTIGVRFAYAVAWDQVSAGQARGSRSASEAGSSGQNGGAVADENHPTAADNCPIVYYKTDPCDSKADRGCFLGDCKESCTVKGGCHCYLNVELCIKDGGTAFVPDSTTTTLTTIETTFPSTTLTTTTITEFVTTTTATGLTTTTNSSFTSTTNNETELCFGVYSSANCTGKPVKDTGTAIPRPHPICKDTVDGAVLSCISGRGKIDCVGSAKALCVNKTGKVEPLCLPKYVPKCDTYSVGFPLEVIEWTVTVKGKTCKDVAALPEEIESPAQVECAKNAPSVPVDIVDPCDERTPTSVECTPAEVW